MTEAFEHTRRHHDPPPPNWGDAYRTVEEVRDYLWLSDEACYDEDLWGLGAADMLLACQFRHDLSHEDTCERIRYNMHWIARHIAGCDDLPRNIREMFGKVADVTGAVVRGSGSPYQSLPETHNG